MKSRMLVLLVLLLLGGEQATAWGQDETRSIPRGATLKRDEDMFAVEDRLTAEDVQRTFLLKNKPAKYHRLELNKGQRIQIDLKSKDFDAYVMIADRRGQVLDQNDDGGADGNSRLIFTPRETGVYKLIATAFAGGKFGKYQLTVRSVLPDLKLRLGDRVEVAQVGKEWKKEKAVMTVEDKLTDEESQLDLGQVKVAKRFSLKMRRDEKFQIELVSDDFDAYLLVLDEDGVVVDMDDDSGMGLDARVVFTAPKRATYSIVAGSTGARVYGKFRLTAELLKE